MPISQPPPRPSILFVVPCVLLIIAIIGAISASSSPFFFGFLLHVFFCPFCHVLDILDCVSNAVTKQAMLGQCKKYWACATQVTTASVNIAQWCAASSASCCQTAADRESRRAAAPCSSQWRSLATMWRRVQKQKGPLLPLFYTCTRSLNC